MGSFTPQQEREMLRGCFGIAAAIFAVLAAIIWSLISLFRAVF